MYENDVGREQHFYFFNKLLSLLHSHQPQGVNDAKLDASFLIRILGSRLDLLSTVDFVCSLRMQRTFR